MTDERASPMTRAMYAIGWLELKYPSEAEKSLRKILPLIQNPFQVKK